ncbi:MAG: hypothetical protein HZC40_00750 [Chloroflexi bacterium]|nr:hypothetical protein [Chloroflexota bacterium]
MRFKPFVPLFVILVLALAACQALPLPGASPAPTKTEPTSAATVTGATAQVKATVAVTTSITATPDAGLPVAPRTPANALPTTAPARPNVLRIAIGAPKTLDPALASDPPIAEILNGLVSHDAKLNVVPELAEKWDTADAKTWTFRLRKDAKFHDGKPLTARDIKYSFERATAPALKSPSAALYLGDIVGVKEKLAGKATEVSGIKVVDDATIQITLDAPKSYFLAKLAHPVAFVVDQANVESGQIATKPNGAGSFAMKEFVPNQRIVLARNAAYVGTPKPSIEQVTYRFDVTNRIAAFQAGELDLVSIAAAEAAEVGNAPALKSDPLLAFGYVAFNTRKPPFDDVKVRQAFALALARDKISLVANGSVIASANIIPSVLPSGNWLAPAADIAKAKQLLAESKYKGKLPDVTWLTTGRETIAPLASALKDALGVNVIVQATDFAALQKQARELTYQMLDIGWVGDYADAQNFLEPLVRANDPDNHTGYANPAVDKLISQAAAEKDPAARAKLYQQIEQMVLADAPIAPLYHYRAFGLAQLYVKTSLQFFPALGFVPQTRFLAIENVH